MTPLALACALVACAAGAYLLYRALTPSVPSVAETEFDRTARRTADATGALTNAVDALRTSLGLDTPPDLTAPVLSALQATSPASGSVAFSFASTEILATATVTVGSATLPLGALARTGAGPYLYAGSASGFAPGEVTVAATGTDAAGNVAALVSVAVTVTAPVDPPVDPPEADHATRQALLASSPPAGSTTTEGAYYGDDVVGSRYELGAVGYRVLTSTTPRADDWGTVLVLDADLSEEREHTFSGKTATIPLGTNPDGSPEQIVLRTVTVTSTFPLTDIPLEGTGGSLHGIRNYARSFGRVLDAHGTFNYDRVPHETPTTTTVRYKVATSGRRLLRTDLYQSNGDVDPSAKTATIEGQCFGMRPYEQGPNALTLDHDNSAPVNWALHALRDFRDELEANGVTGVALLVEATGALPGDREVVRYADGYYAENPSTQPGTTGLRDHDTVRLTGGVRMTYAGAVLGYRAVEFKCLGAEMREVVDEYGNVSSQAFPRADGCMIWEHLGGNHNVADPNHSLYGDGTYRDEMTRFLNHQLLSQTEFLGGNAGEHSGKYIAPKRLADVLRHGTCWRGAPNEQGCRFTGVVLEGNQPGNRGHMPGEGGGEETWSYVHWEAYLQNNQYCGGFSMDPAQGVPYPFLARMELHDCMANAFPAKGILSNNPNVEIIRTGAFGVGICWPDHWEYGIHGSAENITTWGYAGRGGAVYSGLQSPNYVHVMNVRNPTVQRGNLGGAGDPPIECRGYGEASTVAEKRAVPVAQSAQETGIRQDGSVTPYAETNLTVKYVDMRAPGTTGESNGGSLIRFAGPGIRVAGLDTERAVILGLQDPVLDSVDPGRYEAAYQECEFGYMDVFLEPGQLSGTPYRAAVLAGDSRLHHITERRVDGEAISRFDLRWIRYIGSKNGVAYDTVVEDLDYSQSDYGRIIQMDLQYDRALTVRNSQWPTGSEFVVDNNYRINMADLPLTPEQVIARLHVDGGTVVLRENHFAAGKIARFVTRMNGVTDRANGRTSEASGTRALTQANVDAGSVTVDPSLLYEPFDLALVTHDATGVTVTGPAGAALTDRRHPHLTFNVTGMTAGQVITWTARVTEPPA